MHAHRCDPMPQARAFAPRRVVWLVIAIALSGCLSDSQTPDPVVEDFPIAYVKRPLPRDNQDRPIQADARVALTFNAGGDLYVRDRASPSAKERNVTRQYTGGRGDVKDLEVSYDGSKVLFAMRAPEIEGADEEDQPTWNLWEYTFATGALDPVIESANMAEDGQDVAPHYLPDGRIVFSSTRQRQSNAIRLDEGKPQYAALDEDRDEKALSLHVITADREEIRQISFNQSHDLDPTVLASGEIVFTRWDHMGTQNAMSLYKIRPDGTELQLLYGAHSHASGTDGAVVQFLQPRERPDGTLQAILKPFTGTYGGGAIVIIDTARYIDTAQPTYVHRGVLSGPGQISAVTTTIRTDGEVSPGGRFASAYPLADGTDRMLVSWSPCRVMNGTRIVPCSAARLADPAVQEAPPLYGIYILDRAHNTQLPVVPPQEDVMITDVVAAQRRALPTILYDKVAGVELSSELADEDVGLLHIRSVYDFDGAFNALGTAAMNVATLEDLANPAIAAWDERPARFLRLIKAVGIPDDVPGTAFGRSRQQGMREILGYAPIEPDGSVMTKVPANVAFAIDVVDKYGRRIGARHQNWLQLKPGETLQCNGCHTHSSDLPHGHPQGAPALNQGAATSGSWPNTNADFSAEIGETMAQTRVRTQCPSGQAAGNCAPLSPSVDVVFEDLWTADGIGKAASFDYKYSELSTAAPTSAACQTTWTALCRSIINYEAHIHPLWNVDRGADTCTTCHGPTDAMNAAQVPAAQLDLTDGASDDEPDHFKAYRELLFPDNEQELVNGALQDRLVPGVDADGNPVLVPVRAPGPYMSSAGAANSEFVTPFLPGGSHAGRLSEAELRLIIEWLDIGAQYYNDPFEVPRD